MRKNFVSFLVKFFSISLFFLVAAVVLFFSSGYSYDFSNKYIKRTSIIDVLSKPDEASVYLDGKLVGQVLPYQIKGVLPGLYDVMVIKPGFRVWKTEVEVFEDLVTRIEHLFLIPENFENYRKQIADFHEKGDQFFLFNNTLFFINNKKEKLSVETLNSDQLLPIKEFKLPEENITRIQLFGDNFLLTFKNGTRYKGSLTLNSLEKVNLPGAFHFAGDFWLYGKGELLLTLKKNGDEVEHVFTDFKEKIEDMEFYTDFGWNLLKIIKSDSMFPSLYLLQGDQLLLLTQSLQGKPLIGKQGVLYMNNQGGLYYYDRVLNNSVLLKRYYQDFRLLSWFGEGKHFLFESNGQIYFTDLYFDNVYPIFNSQEMDQVFALGNNLYTLKEGKLNYFKWVK